MNQYIQKRLLTLLPVVLVVASVTFFLLHLVPGDPVDIILGDNVSAVDRQSLREQLGLHLPLHEQYGSYLAGLVQGDFGQSIYSRRPVETVLWDHFPATMELALASMFLALLLGIPTGVFMAVKRGKTSDQSLMGYSLLGMSVPGFFLGPMLIWIFAVKLGWFPVSERGGIEHLVLPALSLAIPLSAVLMRITRASVIEVLNEDYVRTARAKGLGEKGIYLRHALANAMMPILTTVGLQVGALLTGTVITETIFDWPGVGTLLYSAIQQRDYPLVQGCILAVALIYLLVNFITDLAYAWANPKVSH